MIEYYKNGVNRNKVIIINKNCKEYQKEVKDLNIQLIDISYEIANLLEDFSKRKKRNETKEVLEKFLDSFNDEILSLYDVDYLFSPDVGTLNIVAILNYYTRENKIIILFLDVKRIDNKLIFSEEGRPDYCEMDISQNLFVLGWD